MQCFVNQKLMALAEDARAFSCPSSDQARGAPVFTPSLPDRKRAVQKATAHQRQHAHLIVLDSPSSSTADLLSEALNNMPHGVVMFDADALLVVSNRRYLEMY